MRVLGVIPARLGSTRLPNKPLQLLAGEPLITRVIQRVMEHGVVQELVVATDSHMIAQVVERAGVRAVLTHDGHLSGTERVAEAAGRPEFTGFDVVANVQGDEPFVTREALAGALDRIAQGDDIGTAARGRALYFSRSVIPHRRDTTAPADGLYWQHVGLYVYTRPALERWVAAPPSPAEQAERLEQLRALHCGLTIGVAPLAEPALPGVDTP